MVGAQDEAASADGERGAIVNSDDDRERLPQWRDVRLDGAIRTAPR
jgi:hypothetical protein